MTTPLETRMERAAPMLTGALTLRDAIGSGEERLLLHAGPPYAGPEAIPAPVRNAAIAAMLFEGWAASFDEAAEAIRLGAVRIAAAQDHGVVTPLAFVVSPSMAVLRVEDSASGLSRYAPVNDGKPQGALRFGVFSTEAIARLRRIADSVATLDVALSEPIALLPPMAEGLAGGDDLHGVVAHANALLRDRLRPRLSGAMADHLDQADQFALNAIMAACAVLLAAWGDGSEGMVTRLGGNGVEVGWSIAGESLWRRAPSAPPRGILFSDTAATPLPSIGDSMVIDACGFGAAALRHAPALHASLEGHIDETGSHHFLRPHPAFPPDLKLGLKLSGETTPVSAILAILDASGGLIGRGIHTTRLTA
ncbi:DUF1116 domain-containing protein [Sphingomonas naphthae]|uniref:DUF1116 domain-containing protein n=1 Tax=Sphingomonas naphthae TaxID=1813468 RepID=A0ABY7TL34_9SPHN|nr:DUF1116 domain-containing protein [Sphingomonas naphthae]WCT73090.1 DUF1116 domain-containing protein [Sphingomonas naphthae]